MEADSLRSAEIGSLATDLVRAGGACVDLWTIEAEAFAAGYAALSDTVIGDVLWAAIDIVGTSFRPSSRDPGS